MRSNRTFDCSRILDFKEEVTRMCKTYNNCVDCPLKKLGLDLNRDCTDIMEMTQASIDAVQNWSDFFPEDFEVGDRVYIKENNYVYPTYYKFIKEFGTENEKVLWCYNKLPQDDQVYTISSINNHPLDDENLAIITRSFPERTDKEFMEVFIVGLNGLTKVL